MGEQAGDRGDLVTFTEGIAEAFPVGTIVDAYPAAKVGLHRRHPDASAPSRDRALTWAKVTNSGLSFGGLEPGRYVAHAEVEGRQRFVAFRVSEQPER